MQIKPNRIIGQNIKDVSLSEQSIGFTRIKNSRVENINLNDIHAWYGVALVESEFISVSLSLCSVRTVIVAPGTKVNKFHIQGLVIKDSHAAVSSSMENGIVYDSKLSNGQYKNFKFRRVAFINTEFYCCKFEESVFEYCSFSGCTFTRCSFNHTGLGIFKSCNFEPMSIVGPHIEEILKWPEYHNILISPNYIKTYVGVLSLYKCSGDDNLITDSFSSGINNEREKSRERYRNGWNSLVTGFKDTSIIQPHSKVAYRFSTGNI